MGGSETFFRTQFTSYGNYKKRRLSCRICDPIRIAAKKIVVLSRLLCKIVVARESLDGFTDDSEILCWLKRVLVPFVNIISIK